MLRKFMLSAIVALTGLLAYVSVLAAVTPSGEKFTVIENLRPEGLSRPLVYIPDFYMHMDERRWTCDYGEGEEGNFYVGRFSNCTMVMDIKIPL